MLKIFNLFQFVESYSSFSERLAAIKEHFGYTNSELGDICEVSHTAIHNILNGNVTAPKIDLITNLERKLSLSLNWLVYGEGSMFKDGKTVLSKNNILSGLNAGHVTQSVGGKHTKSADNSDVEVYKLQSELASVQKQNELLIQQNEFLTKQNEFLQKMMEQYMNSK